MTPRALGPQLAELARAHGLDGYVAIFEAALLGPGQDRALVRRCWDLDAVAARYRAFTAAARRRAVMLRLRIRRRTISDAACFAEKIRLVHEYRKFLFVDPGLPDALLPEEWPGREASRVFREFYGVLQRPAAQFFKAAFEPPPEPAPTSRRALAYLPLNSGGRFSTKAATPAAASSEANVRNSASCS